MSVSMSPTIEITITINGVGGFTTEQAEHIKKWVDEAYAKGYREGMSVNIFTTATDIDTEIRRIHPYPTYEPYTIKVGDDPNYLHTITCDTEKSIK